MVYSDRLIFIPPIKPHLNRYFEIYGDPDTNVHNPFGPLPDMATALRNLEKFMDHQEKYGFGVWAIATLENPDTIIGFGGLSYKRYNDVEKLNLGYRFDKHAWGKGYATEFAKRTIDFAFNLPDISEIFAIVRPTNQSSIKVLEKSGMEFLEHLSDIPGLEASLVYRIRKTTKH